MASKRELIRRLHQVQADRDIASEAAREAVKESRVLRAEVEHSRVHADQVAALLRRVDRLAAAHAQARAQRNLLAIQIEGLTGTPWEQVLESVGVEPQTARDPRPSEPLRGWGAQASTEERESNS
jgi:hypothetical protein